MSPEKETRLTTTGYICLLPIFLLCYAFPAMGQSRLLHRIDSVAGRMYHRAKVDTAYIRRPEGRWIVKLRANVSGAQIETDGTMDGVSYNTELRSALRETFSVSVAYRGLSLGLSLNPAHITGRDNDMELNFSSYGNKVGGEIVLHSSKTFSGTVTRDGIENDVPTGLVRQSILSANGYYVFNNRRFSYPAALSQSYRQRRSAGSWMLGLSLWGGVVSVARSEALTSQPFDISLAQIAIGGGYGHNFVVDRRWLFHISALPTFVAYGHNRMETDGTSRKIDYSFPEVIITSRAAIIYHFPRCFTGLSMVASIMSMGTPDKMEFADSKWRGRLFFGIML